MHLKIALALVIVFLGLFMTVVVFGPFTNEVGWIGVLGSLIATVLFIVFQYVKSLLVLAFLLSDLDGTYRVVGSNGDEKISLRHSFFWPYCVATKSTGGKLGKWNGIDESLQSANGHWDVLVR